jgi:hypothetical protein
VTARIAGALLVAPADPERRAALNDAAECPRSYDVAREFYKDINAGPSWPGATRRPPART